MTPELDRQREAAQLGVPVDWREKLELLPIANGNYEAWYESLRVGGARQRDDFLVAADYWEERGDDEKAQICRNAKNDSVIKMMVLKQVFSDPPSPMAAAIDEPWRRLWHNHTRSPDRRIEIVCSHHECRPQLIAMNDAEIGELVSATSAYQNVALEPFLFRCPNPEGYTPTDPFRGMRSVWIYFGTCQKCNSHYYSRYEESQSQWTASR